MKDIIETQGFIMRPFTESDVPNIFELDSKPEVHEFLGKKPITTMKEAEKIIQDILRQYEENDLGRLAVIEKSTNSFVGWSALKYETNVIPSPYYDIGYRLLPRFWGKGIATVTALAALKYGFEERGFDKICGAAEIANIASNKVLLKIGLKLKETLELFETPCHWYELTREQWESK